MTQLSNYYGYSFPYLGLEVFLGNTPKTTFYILLNFHTLGLSGVKWDNMVIDGKIISLTFRGQVFLSLPTYKKAIS